MTTGNCSLEGCAKPRYCKGLCTLHYQQMRRGYSGRPLSGIPYEARFWAKVNKNGPTPACRPELGPCWIWTGAIAKKTGYGVFGKPSKLAHRISHELSIGPIPIGLEIDHLCRVRNCVNPEHVEPVTRRDNQLRGYTVSGLNAAKVTCQCGRAYDVIRKDGRRGCRSCDRNKTRRYRARLRAKRNAA